MNMCSEAYMCIAMSCFPVFLLRTFRSATPIAGCGVDDDDVYHLAMFASAYLYL